MYEAFNFHLYRCIESSTFYLLTSNGLKSPGLEVIKLLSCSTQLSIKRIMLINVKMPTIVGILTFISMIDKTSKSLKA